MAISTLKSFNSDNQAEVTADHELKVTGNITASSPSTGPTGDPVPTEATLVGGMAPNGDLIPIKVTIDGKVVTEGFDGGFDNITPGYPTQVAVGITSVLLLPANILRKYAHVSNNSTESIFIQYSAVAMLNKGIRIGPGGLYTLDAENLYRGDINAIGLMDGQLIDVLQGE